MDRQRGYHYASSSDSETEPVSAPPRHRYHRRRQNRPQEPSPETVAPAPQKFSKSPAAGNKKKGQNPSQESINSIWDKFSKKKFSKALAVLPFSPVQASASSERDNELLEAGYERAAEECRRKVRKIISECMRVNTRYRDPGWDLDWDFKWEKGHTLNSLTRTKFDISRRNLLNTAANVPRAVKRVHEIFESPTFMENVLPGDIKQGSLGNCWFVASLTGLANVPGGVKRICVEYDTKIGIYGFVFYRDGEWIYSIVDDKLFLKSPCWDSPSMQRDLLQRIDREDVERVYRKTYQTGSKALFFAQNKDQNETWVPLLEKAYAKAHGDFACLAGGWIGEALEDLSGGVTTELLASDIFDLDAFWNNELRKVNHEFLFGCSTGLLDGGYGARDGITEGHAYVIMDARELKNGTRLCKLRNPWGKVGKGNWEGAWSDGSKEWTTEAQEELNHTFGSDSTFWIQYEDMLRKYLHFDRTRLFRDPDWRSCQRWIGVEVPWKSQYNEKFHIKLTKESPVVLVLSQLDNRYFRGLQGQYNFRLQFRLHEEGRPGAEDYIVRSHGNYMMDRSVSIEVPSLGPGNYTVYISISGERNTALPSTEDAVRSQCKGREENEKLAQVGQAYDLAHLKAASHLDKLSKVRKKAENKKASEARKKERRQTWKKRHDGRTATKKQKEKNEAKKAEAKRCKKAKADAAAKAKEAASKEIDANTAKSKTQPKEEAAKPILEPLKQVDDLDIADPKQPAEDEAKGYTEKPESQPTDKAIQTDSTSSNAGQSQTEADIDNASTTSNSSGSSGSPQFTPQESPQSRESAPVAADTAKVDVPPTMEPIKAISGTPPPQQTVVSAPLPSNLIGSEKPLELKVHYCSCSTCKPPAAAEESEYSSDSPVEDHELPFEEDSDDDTRAALATNEGEDSDNEGTPSPWNAVAVVGFRVYSKDEDLELRVVMEGGELEQDGMGNLGEADLDNAVSNAAGQREKKETSQLKSGVSDKRLDQTKDTIKQSPEIKMTTSDACDAGTDNKTESAGNDGPNPTTLAAKPAYRIIVERQTSEFDRVIGKAKTGTSYQEPPTNSSMEDPKVEASTPTPHQSAGQQANNTQEAVNAQEPANQEASLLPARTRSAKSEESVDNITKTVLLVRCKLQNACRKLLLRGQIPLEDDLQEMSDHLAKLESYPDLEASVILSTKIHKVMMAILKLDHLPKDDGFKLSVGSRAQALLDDYELSLMTSEGAQRTIMDGH